MKRLLLISAACLLSLACMPRRIPGTEIDDTSETRAILSVMEQYRQALEARDAEQLLSLVSPNFKDNSGTATIDDDFDFQRLKAELPGYLSKLENVRLEMTVRKIQVAEGAARAIYTYTTSFRMPALAPKPQSDSEIKEMAFERLDGHWKIISGI